ncbi:hypothetical protein ElyMa_002347600 [Elysia marginata]|uniref:Uncharacterized protein n=1 Tax=Elysia marginata TaxID=1093978 RepID=A0AAV4G8A2_9GAST|nr:hypothetical protein ElyMa_002347600 [Elysia marginata]
MRVTAGVTTSGQRMYLQTGNAMTPVRYRPQQPGSVRGMSGCREEGQPTSKRGLKRPHSHSWSANWLSSGAIKEVETLLAILQHAQDTFSKRCFRRTYNNSEI